MRPTWPKPSNPNSPASKNSVSVADIAAAIDPMHLRIVEALLFAAAEPLH